MRPDLRTLLYAIAVVSTLLVAAAFGGPHGALGAVPWLLNLPGILLIVAVGSNRYLLARVALAVVVQVAVWYGIIALVRRRRRLRPR